MPCQTLGKVSTLHCSSSLCINEYLAVGIGGYLCTSNLHALIAALLDALTDLSATEMLFHGKDLLRSKLCKV